VLITHRPHLLPSRGSQKCSPITEMSPFSPRWR
jgi:hypothetical protein